MGNSQLCLRARIVLGGRNICAMSIRIVFRLDRVSRRMVLLLEDRMPDGSCCSIQNVLKWALKPAKYLHF